MGLKTWIAVGFFCAAGYGRAAHLSPQATRDFDSYIAPVESRLSQQHEKRETYLAVFRDGTSRPAAVEDQLRAAGTRIEPVHGGTWPVSGGLMHHWRAVAFVPGADASGMLALLRDPNHLSRYYAPEVVSSRSLADGANATSLIRFKKQKIVTVVLDAEFQSRSGLAGGDRGYSLSRSMHVWQVDHPGGAGEHRRREGDDDGYLWKLNSYWSFVQTGDGLLIECEAVSLTRDIPFGLGWLITPIIESLPRESLEFTLNATKNALMAYARKETRDDHAN